MPTSSIALMEAEDDRPELTRFDKTGRPFVVGRYHADDRADLESFYEHFEPLRAAQGLPPTGRDRVARWLDSVLPQGIHLVARREGRLIGHALVVPLDQPGVAEYAVFLHQDERGKGAGTELNRAAIEFARDAGLLRLWLSVEPHNRAAVRSYEKVGFRYRPATIFSSEAEMTLDLPG